MFSNRMREHYVNLGIEKRSQVYTFDQKNNLAPYNTNHI